MATDDNTKAPHDSEPADPSRRGALKSMGALTAGLAAGAGAAACAAEKPVVACVAKNPYGGGPGTGISLPPYFKPTEYIKNNNVYLPGTEEVGKDEMRISFIGSCPFPPRIDQAGTAIMVECGPNKRFFFDLGSGCLRNVVAMQMPIGLVNDIFLTHLHIDHYADLPYLLPFSAAMGLRFKPLRVVGPSGRTPELGTKAMCENMKKMLKWHLEEFESCPVGDGYEIDITEFDWKKENDVCYDKDGVVVRHWPRSHGKDGASAYRLDWNGLSFVWTGDGRPDELTMKYAKGVDVFVTESQTDVGALMSMKMGLPVELFNYVIDTHHTPHFAAGYLMKQVNPRIGMITHVFNEPGLSNEVSAGIRSHWDGLFVVGAPDVKVINVTKDAIWARDAALQGLANLKKPNTGDALALAWDSSRGFGHMLLPKVQRPRETQQEAFVRKLEIDPVRYYPPDVNRPLVTEMPTALDMVRAKVGPKVEGTEETVEGLKARVQELEQKLKEQLEGK